MGTRRQSISRRDSPTGRQEAHTSAARASPAHEATLLAFSLHIEALILGNLGTTKMLEKSLQRVTTIHRIQLHQCFLDVAEGHAQSAVRVPRRGATSLQSRCHS